MAQLITTEKIIADLAELKSTFERPRMYLAEYLSDLTNQVDMIEAVAICLVLVVLVIVALINFLKLKVGGCSEVIEMNTYQHVSLTKKPLSKIVD